MSFSSQIFIELHQRIKHLEQRVTELETEKAKLQALLSRNEQPKKDSHNSSIPPSAEDLKSKAIRQTRSLRVLSGRPSGGQRGHHGTTLQMSDKPDHRIEHAAGYCTKCGLSLSGLEGKISEIRQSIDLPLPVKPIITNHVSIARQCSCGHCNAGTFPGDVKPGVSYGVNVHATVAYLSVSQYIPFKRMTEVLEHFYGLKISQGTVSNILNRMRKQSASAYESIRESIEKSAVVGADETGAQLNGKLNWMWIFQNAALTYVFHHASRGKAAIEEHFPDGFANSILVTDRHRSYFNVNTSGHQLCLAHLLRNLIYLGELDNTQQWSANMLQLLQESIHQVKTLQPAEIDIGKIKDRFNGLIQQDLSSLDSKFEALRKSLEQHAGHLFLFLENAQVPYDNNASERGVRPLKVKQKVSGMFKTENGAKSFCQLHSIIDTARKNKQDPFLALIAVAKNL